VPAFVVAALRGDPVIVHGDGLQSRDFTYVSTVTDVIASAVAGRVSHDGPVNLAFGTRTNLLDLIASLSKILDTQLDVHHIDPRPGDVRHSQASSDILQTLFPQIAPVPLDVGLTETIDWMRSYVSRVSP
jgi:UDP-glucose 4-epimerase